MMWNCLSTTAEVNDLYAQTECSHYPSYRSIADPSSLEKALEALLSSKKPLIICGQGALSSGAGPAVQQLAQALNICTSAAARGVNNLHKEVESG